ncbi:exodeoxyribonuclease I [Buchnera aphidicola (Muscaphis stroyani)]|uniref:Exodeoxyribonuclease I n=1 Tax=Buchnera aphidicola (Muscaphis stroyani) TaxID=1241869 RepID=A0A4D6YFQ9_9GAMM|nr:exodeoxyribonuclease I [Buchnera aphidicola]QCI24588.1 exodeoxyribonuclease I [Buchnera aphidicola (Muscaphis stroyani)]
MNYITKNNHLKNLSTFLFYDYETFGTDTALDKAAQFACIRTDINLNIIDDPQCFYCFPPDDYLPDPSSILITEITPQRTKEYGTNEYNFSRKIYNILKKPNTCIIGYNNINFDDEITRNLFYRNFFEPYEWSWKNGNSRWDLLNILRACYALRPSGIQWPKNNLGLTSFKLSDLTKANGIIHTHAHDAASDVYATIEIARLIKNKKNKLFNFFFQYRKKNNIYSFLNSEKLNPIVYVSSFFGSIRHNFSCILPIILHEKNPNIFISIDLLSEHIEELISLFKKKLLNTSIKNFFNLGIVLVYLNRCPILSTMKIMRKKDFERLNFDYNLYNKNISLIKKNNFIFQKIKILFSYKHNAEQTENVDLKIYDSFFSSYDKNLIKIVRNTKPLNLKNLNLNFRDARLNELFFRYRARNFLYTLNEVEKKIWFDHCIKIFNKNSLKEYMIKIKRLLHEHALDQKKIKLINDLLDYVISISKKFNKKLI